jgi:flagellar biosynthesis protein FlhF
MNIVPFIADSAADALTQIRHKLGPDAVVLNVRRLPANGLSRLWSKPKIEVMACAPDVATQDPAAPSAPSLLDVRDSVTAISPNESSEPELAAITPRRGNRYSIQDSAPGQWRTTALLESMGVTPLNAERVSEALVRTQGERAPASLGKELSVTREALKGFWRTPRATNRGTHIFLGPPGSGKTTAICKWLTQATLIDGTSARVWRLDVPRANTAESLNVHCEILNAPVERSWNASVMWPEDLLFIDLPGFEASDDVAFAETQKLLATIPGAQITLVLNAAYDSIVLQNQVRAFSRLPISHLLFTHLDEETRWSKLWNFVLGTNYSLNFLSAGQNIPGRFLPAAPELLFPEIFRQS